MKRFISFLCSIVLVLSSLGTAFADEDLSQKSTSELQRLKEKLEIELEQINTELASRENTPTTKLSSQDVVVFGKYEQDNNYSNGPDDISWYVLKVGNGKALLISKYCLEAKQFEYEKGKKTSWETCSLRKWLNEAFLTTAFSEEERDSILLTTVDNSKEQAGKSQPYSISCDSTEDKIFLLSGSEVEENLNFATGPAARPTEYALTAGLQKINHTKYCQWWTRGIVSSIANLDTNSKDIPIETFAEIVRNNGMFKAEAQSVQGVRPAMWVEISAIENSVVK